MARICFLLIMSCCFSALSVFGQNDSILIDFGNDLSPFPWNNVTNARFGTVTNLTDAFGQITPVSIEVVDSFNGINNTGTTTALPSLGIPGDASGDSFFGNTVLFANLIQPTGGVLISQLDTAKEYELAIFASRIASDSRETRYIVEGEQIDTLHLEVASNTDVEVVTMMKPKSDGTFRVTAEPGPNNNNTYGFFYLGALKLRFDETLTGGPESLEIVRPNGGEYWQVGKVARIKWESQNVSSLDISYSHDGGMIWHPITTVSGFQGFYDWTIPNTPSTECLVRLSSDSSTSTSAMNFTIADDSTTCSIVVLGSSTAAGTGPSHPDSTWVNKYRRALYQKDTRFEVTNLAQGGYSTYRLLPNGTPIPVGVNLTIDTNRNVNKAMDFDPYAVIVNLPSNDAANNFSVTEQMKNFRYMRSFCDSMSVDFWLCTTQPRNFGNQSQIDIQVAVRDSIFEEYGSFSVDFWNDIALVNGHIDPAYDSGDGVHLNDAGHRILVDRMLAEQIDTLCGYVPDTPSSIRSVSIEKGSWKVYPNPNNGVIQIRAIDAQPGNYTLKLVDVLGVLHYKQILNITANGLEEFSVDLRPFGLGESGAIILEIHSNEPGNTTRFEEKILFQLE